MIEPVAMNTKQAAVYISMSVDYMKKARITGKGPIFSKIGSRVVYRKHDLDAFLSKHLQHNTSGQGGIDQEEK